MARSQQRIETRWSADNPPGFIIPEALYTIDEVKARLRMGNAAWRQLRRKGAKPIRFGQRHYITGAAVIEVFMKIAEEDGRESCG
jgi:hypothetical protein